MEDKKIILVKDLIKRLEWLDPDRQILISCDEEWNTLYWGFEISKGEDGSYVIFGLSGQEEY